MQLRCPSFLIDAWRRQKGATLKLRLYGRDFEDWDFDLRISRLKDVRRILFCIHVATAKGDGNCFAHDVRSAS